VPADWRKPLLNLKPEEHFNNQADKKLRGAFAAGGIDISAHGITQAHLETMGTFAKQVQAAYVAYCAAAEEMGEAPDSSFALCHATWWSIRYCYRPRGRRWRGQIWSGTY
jgi:hypothetical protein